MILACINEDSDILIKRRGRDDFQVIVSALRLLHGDLGLKMIEVTTLPQTLRYHSIKWIDVRHVLLELEEKHPDIRVPAKVREYFEYQTHFQRFKLWFHFAF